MAKKILYSGEAREKLLKGVEQVYKTVVTTLGPRGRFVLIENPGSAPTATKDGVTCAKNVDLEDPVENMGAQLMKTAAEGTNEAAGDGTTTSTVLAYSILSEGMKSVASGTSPVCLKKGIDMAVEDAVKHLHKMSREVGSKEDIEAVASISANNDKEIGSLIAEAIDKVGSDGVVTTEESKTMETSVDFVDGMKFDKGFLSAYFCDDKDTGTTTLEDPLILMYDKKITNVQALLPALEISKSAGKPMLIIAEDIEAEALSTLILNRIRGILNVIAVKSPGFGDRKKDLLEDIAVITGGKVITEELGMALNKVTWEDLGHAKSVKISRTSTTIVDGTGSEENISKRVSEIKSSLASANSDYEREKLQERLAKLAGGVAVIRIGANTEAELKEKKYRVEDALNATRAAIEEGIIPGGGVALCKISKLLSVPKDLDDEEAVGYKIVKKALEAPIKMIAENAGVNGAVVVDELWRTSGSKDGKSSDFGFDARNLKWVDSMYNAGIIDPVKVTRSALQNAAGVASVILTAECAVADIPSNPAQQGTQI